MFDDENLADSLRNLHLLFRERDWRRSGCVSTADFVRVLEQLGGQREQITVLANQFAEGSGGGSVNYAAFMAHMESLASSCEASASPDSAAHELSPTPPAASTRAAGVSAAAAAPTAEQQPSPQPSPQPPLWSSLTAPQQPAQQRSGSVDASRWKVRSPPASAPQEPPGEFVDRLVSHAASVSRASSRDRSPSAAPTDAASSGDTGSARQLPVLAEAEAAGAARPTDAAPGAVPPRRATVRAIFDCIDANRDGLVSADDVGIAFAVHRVPVPQEVVDVLFEGVGGGSDEINFDAFTMLVSRLTPERIVALRAADWPPSAVAAAGTSTSAQHRLGPAPPARAQHSLDSTCCTDVDVAVEDEHVDEAEEVARRVEREETEATHGGDGWGEASRDLYAGRGTQRGGGRASHTAPREEQRCDRSSAASTAASAPSSRSWNAPTPATRSVSCLAAASHSYERPAVEEFDPARHRATAFTPTSTVAAGGALAGRPRYARSTHASSARRPPSRCNSPSIGTGGGGFSVAGGGETPRTRSPPVSRSAATRARHAAQQHNGLAVTRVSLSCTASRSRSQQSASLATRNTSMRVSQPGSRSTSPAVSAPLTAASSSAAVGVMRHRGVAPAFPKKQHRHADPEEFCMTDDFDPASESDNEDGQHGRQHSEPNAPAVGRAAAAALLNSTSHDARRPAQQGSFRDAHPARSREGSVDETGIGCSDPFGGLLPPVRAAVAQAAPLFAGKCSQLLALCNAADKASRGQLPISRMVRILQTLVPSLTDELAVALCTPDERDSHAAAECNYVELVGDLIINETAAPAPQAARPRMGADAREARSSTGMTFFHDGESADGGREGSLRASPTMGAMNTNHSHAAPRGRGGDAPSTERLGGKHSLSRSAEPGQTHRGDDRTSLQQKVQAGRERMKELLRGELLPMRAIPDGRGGWCPLPEFLAAHDPDDTGYITEEGFRSALEMLYGSFSKTAPRWLCDRLVKMGNAPFQPASVPANEMPRHERNARLAARHSAAAHTTENLCDYRFVLHELGLMG